MVRHIVMFKLRTCESEVEKSDLLLQLKYKLEQLPALIPQIREFEVGINKSTVNWAYDIVLNSVFDSLEDLDLYVVHPAHQGFVNFNKDKSIAKAAVDYIF